MLRKTISATSEKQFSDAINADWCDQGYKLRSRSWFHCISWRCGMRPQLRSHCSYRHSKNLDVAANVTVVDRFLKPSMRYVDRILVYYQCTKSWIWDSYIHWKWLNTFLLLFELYCCFGSCYLYSVIFIKYWLFCSILAVVRILAREGLKEVKILKMLRRCCIFHSKIGV